jgi:hypothetical protein
MKPETGKMLVLIGGVLVLVGLVFWTGIKVPLLGKLPGDLHLKGENYEVFIPLGTSVLVSLILSLLLLLFRK